MVDVLGHLGMALLWLAPAWYVLDRRKTAAALVGTGFWFVPDVDLVLSNYVPGIHHHGVFHTVLVVTILAAILGPLLGRGLEAVAGDAGRFSFEAEGDPPVLGFVAVWIAGLSHLFADMLSAPDVTSRVEPFWPAYNGSVVLLDLLWYSSFWATWGLFFAGLAVTLGAWYRKGPSGEPRTSSDASE